MDPARSREEVASLYRRHVAMVYQICLVLLKNVPDAEDASQNVFRKVMEWENPFRVRTTRGPGSSPPPGTSVKISSSTGGAPDGRTNPC